ncbi:hypothetical protein GKE62_01750 [Novosphingobium sp. Gsoil 351]|nr:hypothetical protein [Novosphingobium sp. Gsoil 351]QGN53457.1 hypothetical protein GKE62_01750 [Novosphingobium sp. Gsoil 351]
MVASFVLHAPPQVTGPSGVPVAPHCCRREGVIYGSSDEREDRAIVALMHSSDLCRASWVIVLELVAVAIEHDEHGYLHFLRNYQWANKLTFGIGRYDVGAAGSEGVPPSGKDEPRVDVRGVFKAFDEHKLRREKHFAQVGLHDLVKLR